MKGAYDVIMDMELREVYNKLGPEAVNSNKRIEETQILLEMAVFYISWGLLCFVLTLGKSSANARKWIFTGEIFMLVVEVSLLLTPGEDTLPTWFLPSITEHEIIWVLHSIFPAYMNGCRSILGVLYVDVDKQTRDLLLALHEGHQDLLLVLRDIQVNMQSLQNGAAVTQGQGRPVPIRATPSAKIRELEERMKGRATRPDLSPAPSKMGNSSFWLFLGAYVLFYYFKGA
ncbi:unnamed protein product [Chrysoparadoxa australica]